MSNGEDGGNTEALRQPDVAPAGRDYGIYARLMDEAARAKADSIIRYFGEIPDGAVIADIGSGTGKVAELLAEMLRESNVSVYAVDRSHELREMEARWALINFIFDDATELNNIPPGSIDIMYHTTVGHEIFSEHGQEGLRRTLSAVLRSLGPGGREIWRDMVKPSYTGNVLMRIDVHDGVDTVEEAMIDGFLDYSKLSTRALFDRFHQEFLGGQAFKYQTRQIGDCEYIELPAQFAQEFILRKDYTANWRQEILEQYLYWTQEEAQMAFKEAGFDEIAVHPDDNLWIRQNRLRGKVELFIEKEGGNLEEVEFTTHMVVVGQKPGVVQASREAALPGVDYAALLASVDVDEAHGKVKIGNETLTIGDFVGEGAHKRVYINLSDDLTDGGNTVIKVVRTDEDIHNVFKSLLQAIQRQQILEKYGVPHMKILAYDRQGPPYRYLIQERLPEGSLSAATLIQRVELTERDVVQIAAIVNRFEEGKRWQLDMSPFNWARVASADGQTQMVYTGSTVYAYDEKWTFGRIGVLQWSDTKYVPETGLQTAVIPTWPEINQFMATLDQSQNQTVEWFRKYLSRAVFPHQSISPK